MRPTTTEWWRAALALILSLTVLGAALGSPGTTVAFDPVAPPPVTAQAVYVYDATLGVVLYELNADERRSPASVTKIGTALMVRRLAPDVNQLVTVDAADVLTVDDGESMMALLEGDVLTVESLLYGLMLNSGNDAANTLARFLGQQLLESEGGGGDPVQRFIAEMNAWFAEVGLSNTHFTNAEGLYNPDHYTSARDLGTLAGLLLADPLLATIVGTAETTVTSEFGNAYTLQNTNKLLGEPGITGMKTGTLPEAGACLVASKRGPGGTNLISVTLGSSIDFSENGIQDPESDQRFSDARTLFASAESDFAWISPTAENGLDGLTAELEAWDVALTDERPLVVRSGQLAALRYTLRLGPPVGANEEAGELLVYDGPTLIDSRAVVQLN
ncbi:MAG: D-alanyl-D-alanine carboxypeptidase [Thermomicrobiales bacterium]|nr:D-alanyl-D-alanine carboxypeptidase [Thermomicrobiales bacterium]